MADEGKLESILRRVNSDAFRFGRSVQAMHGLALDSGKIDWLIESLDDSVVTIFEPTSV